MSEESKSNAPAAPAPIGEIEHGPSKFDQFMEKNLKKIIFLVLLIIVAVAAYVITSQLKEAERQEAGNALLSAESPADYRKVASDYADSAAGESAQLLLAGQLWDEGAENEAIETLRGLIGKEHPAATQAQFTLAGMLLKQGKTDEAQSAYEAVLADSNAEYLHPLTLIALGDIATAAGEEEKAKAYFQRKLDDFSAYGDSGLAVTRLNLVGVDLAKKVPPPPAPEPSANPDAGIPSSFTQPIPMQRPPEPAPANSDVDVDVDVADTPDEAPATEQTTPTETSTKSEEMEKPATSAEPAEATPTFQDGETSDKKEKSDPAPAAGDASGESPAEGAELPSQTE